MRFARDFRSIAWRALEKYYWMPVLVTLVAGLLGAGVVGPGLTVSFAFSKESFEAFGGSPFANPLVLFALVTASVASMFALASFIIGGAMDIGLARYTLSIVDEKREPFSTVFSGFPIFGKALGLRCWKALFIFLWSLLLVVPGLIAAYRYSMAEYIMAEDPSIGAREAVSISKKMMHGNKWRLFCLHLSFIGWYLLSALTAGIGMVFLAPYVNAAVASFYLEVSGQSYRLERYGTAA